MRYLAVIVALTARFPAAGEQLKLLDILDQELRRNYKILSEKADPLVYFLAYAVTEQENHSIAASMGTLYNSSERKGRYLDVTVRVGSRKLDNYHRIRGDFPQFTRGTAIAVEDSPAAIQRALWAETDRLYRLAAQRLINIRTNKEVLVAEREASDDFSAEEPSQFEEEPPMLRFDRLEWTRRAKLWSAEFMKYPGILTSQVSVSAVREVKFLVTTEGTRVRHGRNLSRIAVTAQSKASDGMDLSTGYTYDASDPGRLPDDREVRKQITKVAADLTRLLNAPLVDPYVGPAILSGRAAGVFFHEIFGHRVEGHRLKDESDGQTFARSVGTKVLPDFISVVFDPTKRNGAGEDLNGLYAFDDEGVKARPVTVVEKGIFKTFLMSRTPIPSLGASNAHGRRQPGAEVVSRQSNLIVDSSASVPPQKLRELLIAEVKRQNKLYGYYFEDITGGFTTTERRGIQAFKVIPVVVYRVYADGRKDELVRGADIVGTPLASFAKIVATDDKPEVFNGYCGAESGSVPVSALVPAVLVSELEIQKKDSSRERPPLLPPPTAGGR